ncbi:MAG: serine/threonine protein kinase [Thermoguttaceae bacterium]|nr:serine/threonine protein kinase [Thermoguttaceae bacterium]
MMTESILPFENAPANPEIYPGIRLGAYLVQRKIAFGGMATVWLARHEPLDRLVALKILRAEFTADPRNILRFTREARSAARLDSPAIVRIYEVGSFPRRRPFGARFFPFLFGKGARPLYYIAQEYLPGMNLAQYVRRRGPLSVRQALTVTAAVARALETADRAGVVHRDIKPENILVSESGEIKVADFGLAFSAEERQENDLSLTISGVTLGTPLYMSPEQGEGKKTDVRSDLYSLGAALFWMLTGRPPYEGGSPMSVILRHASAEIPDPRRYRDGIPDSLARLCRRLMAKDPAGRFQTPAELSAELARIAGSLQGESLFSGGEEDTAGENFLAEPQDRLAFTQELSALNATQRFQTALFEARRIQIRGKPRRRLLGYGAVCAAAAAAALAAGGYWAFRSAGSEGPHFESVEEQWVFASQTNTAEAWEELLRFFPDEPFWTVRAKKHLALALIDEARVKEASLLFDAFASGREGGASETAFGKAGQAWCLAFEGKTAQAASLLSELRHEGAPFDRQTEEVLVEAGELLRKQP